MKISTVYNNPKQGCLPLFLSDCLDLLDPVLTFDKLMGGINLNKYLTDIPEYTTGRLRYNPVNMLKTVLFGFMTSGYCSLRELEDNCKVNIRYFRIRLKTFLTTSIKLSSTRSMWICNISTSMVPSLKQTPTNIPGFGRRLPKSSVTSFIKKSLWRLRKSTKKSHRVKYRFQLILSMYQII